jgi:hypothetical protein
LPWHPNEAITEIEDAGRVAGCTSMASRQRVATNALNATA